MEAFKCKERLKYIYLNKNIVNEESAINNRKNIEKNEK